jgi:hypothetical protein
LVRLSGTRLVPFQEMGWLHSPLFSRVARCHHCARDIHRRYGCRENSERKERAMSTPVMDEAELARMLACNGLNLAPDQVRAILPGVPIFQQMVARVNAPLPREVGQLCPSQPSNRPSR